MSMEMEGLIKARSLAHTMSSTIRLTTQHHSTLDQETRLVAVKEVVDITQDWGTVLFKPEGLFINRRPCDFAVIAHEKRVKAPGFVDVPLLKAKGDDLVSAALACEPDHQRTGAEVFLVRSPGNPRPQVYSRQEKCGNASYKPLTLLHSTIEQLCAKRPSLEADLRAVAPLGHEVDFIQYV
jgi:hypothetical protein